MQYLIEDLDNFSGLSGLKPNYDECTILRLGYFKNSTFTLPCSLPITWPDGEVDIRGIQIRRYIHELSTMHFNRKLVKIDKILQPRRGKYPSIQAKIALINSLVISQFSHLLMVLPTSDD
jgi:hypothetical protein